MTTDGFEKFAPAEPEPDRGTSVALKVAIAAVAAIAVVAGFVVYGFATAPEPQPAAAYEPKPLPSRTAEPDDPRVGECVRVDKTNFDERLTRVGGCDKGTHTHVIAGLQRGGEDCGSASGQDRDQYLRHTHHWGLALCLVPAFEDGQCYDTSRISSEPGLVKQPCGAGNKRVKSHRDRADKAACEGGSVALVYPELKATYCFAKNY